MTPVNITIDEDNDDKPSTSTPSPAMKHIRDSISGAQVTILDSDEDEAPNNVHAVLYNEAMTSLQNNATEAQQPKRFKLSALSDDQSPVPPKKPGSFVNYNIDDLASGDETDDDEKPKKPVSDDGEHFDTQSNIIADTQLGVWRRVEARLGATKVLCYGDGNSGTLWRAKAYCTCGGANTTKQTRKINRSLADLCWIPYAHALYKAHINSELVVATIQGGRVAGTGAGAVMTCIYFTRFI